MGNRAKLPVNLQTFGGVKYDQNSLVKRYVTNENGQKRYNLILAQPQVARGGDTAEQNCYSITVSYPEQKATNGASLFIKPGKGCPEVKVSNLAFGNILGSKDNDTILMEGCRETKLDISNDGRKDWVTIRDGAKFKSTHNTVIGGAANPSSYSNGSDSPDETTVSTSRYYQCYEFPANGTYTMKEETNNPTINYEW